MGFQQFSDDATRNKTPFQYSFMRLMCSRHVVCCRDDNTFQSMQQETKPHFNSFSLGWCDHSTQYVMIPTLWRKQTFYWFVGPLSIVVVSLWIQPQQLLVTFVPSSCDHCHLTILQVQHWPMLSSVIYESTLESLEHGTHHFFFWDHLF